MPRIRRPPQLVLHQRVEAKELMALTLLREGKANTGHFNALLDMIDLLLLGSYNKGDDKVKELAHLARADLKNVQERYLKTKRLGLSGEELKMLQAVHDVSTDFWKRQSGAYYEAAVNTLEVFRKQQGTKG